MSVNIQQEFANEVARRLQQAGYQALWAGGCVRDHLLELTPDDYDVATDARPEQVRKLFGHKATLAIGASFGVILVLGPNPDSHVEVATFRTEGPYLDGRHPSAVTFATPQEDARRRDFTINGMFLDPFTDQLYDYVGGQQDLDHRIIRAIGDPRQRFAEDKLRLLRAVRMAARFDAQIEPATAAAVRSMASELPVVSPERIAQELRKMLVHNRRRRAVELAYQLGLLEVIFPEFTPLLPCSSATQPANPPAAPPDWQTTLKMLDRLQSPSFPLAFATLLRGIDRSDTAGECATATPQPPAGGVAEVCHRLRLSNAEAQQTLWLTEHQHALDNAPALPLPKLKRLLVEAGIDDLRALQRARAEVTGEGRAAVEFCEQFLRNTPPGVLNPAPLLTGNDLIAHGLKPGAAFKRLLEQVRDAQLEGTLGTREQALQLVDQLQRNSGEAM